MEERPAGDLACVECGRRQTAGERGLRSYLTADEEEPAEAIVHCPKCASRKLDSGPRGAER